MHFHHNLYGRCINEITDHFPHETIFSNLSHKTPPRVQRLILLLQFYLCLEFQPGSEIQIANTLSCLHLPDVDEKLATEIDMYVHQISRHLPVSDEKILGIQEETSKDSKLRILAKTIHERWLKCRKTC